MSIESDLNRALNTIIVNHYLREHELKIICSPGWAIQFQEELYQHFKYMNFGIRYDTNGFAMTTYMGMPVEVDRNMSIPCAIVLRDKNF